MKFDFFFVLPKHSAPSISNEKQTKITKQEAHPLCDDTSLRFPPENHQKTKEDQILFYY